MITHLSLKDARIALNGIHAIRETYRDIADHDQDNWEGFYSDLAAGLLSAIKQQEVGNTPEVYMGNFKTPYLYSVLGILETSKRLAAQRGLEL